MAKNYDLFSETYRRAGDTRRADLYAFLEGCSDEDIFTLFDSAIFNEIAKSYLAAALSELVNENEIEEEQARTVRRRFGALFDEVTAKEAYEHF